MLEIMQFILILLKTGDSKCWSKDMNLVFKSNAFRLYKFSQKKIHDIDCLCCTDQGNCKILQKINFEIVVQQT